MLFSRITALVAAFAATLALGTVAYGDPGKSPNGPPGPAGNPNHEPAAAPQATAPAEPQRNEGKGAAKKSEPKQKHVTRSKPAKQHVQSHSEKTTKAKQTPNQHSEQRAAKKHGKSNKGGRPDRPAGKITICHATKSGKNPYVRITISRLGLRGHGPEADPRHHAGSWEDIIPAPAGGCPEKLGEQPGPTGTTGTTGTTGAQGSTEQGTPATTVAAQPEVALTAPAGVLGAQGVLGVQAEGEGAPAADVLGDQAEGGSVPAAATETRDVAASGRLAFTGFDLVFVLLAAAAALLAGLALRRVGSAHGD